MWVRTQSSKLGLRNPRVKAPTQMQPTGKKKTRKMTLLHQGDLDNPLGMRKEPRVTSVQEGFAESRATSIPSIEA